MYLINTRGIRSYPAYIRSVFQMSDPLTNMGAKSGKSKYMKWLNEENQTKPSPPTVKKC